MRTRTIITRMLSGILVALGFTSCETQSEEYGSPYVRFQVKGTVTDEHGNPLENIRVIVREDYFNRPNPYADDTTYTDSQGKFESSEITGSGFKEQKTYFDDIDGEANGGSFKSDSIRISDMDSKRTEKGDSWYKGRFEFSINQQLKKKE